jgi:hypothetical protein
VETNPYEGPVEQQPAADLSVYPPIKTSWRIVPAVLVGLLGVLILLFDLHMTSSMLYFWSRMHSEKWLSGPFAVDLIGMQAFFITSIFAAGCLWIASAVAIWRCRWKSACIRFVLGGFIVTIPVLWKLSGNMVGL